MRFLTGLLLTLCAVWLPRPGWAEEPHRPLRLVVPAPPGGNMDATARLIAPLLSQQLRVPVVVENKPGASTILGTELVARGPNDGKLLLMVGSSYSINPSMVRLSFDPFRDLRPVVQLSRERLILAARADLQADTLGQLLALARSKPEGLKAMLNKSSNFESTLRNSLIYKGSIFTSWTYSA